MVQYIGYNGGRGIPYAWLTWSALGYAHLVMDNRGQGGGGKHTADTPDIGPDGHGSSSPGFLTRGIEDPHRHYYRRLITDAVRAVDAAKAHDAVDAGRVAVLGGSQGGGLALAVAGLRDDVAAAVADVPFLCHYRRASQITDAGPYAEIARWLSGHRFRIEEAMETLSYFDGVNFAARANAPAWFSVGLMDRVCPSSTVFAAYHRYAGPAEIEVFPYNGHEGGAEYDLPRKLGALRGCSGPEGPGPRGSPAQRGHRRVVAGDPADAAAAHRARPAEQHVGVRGLHAPAPGVLLRVREGEVAVEDVAAGQPQVPLQVERGLGLDAGLAPLVEGEAVGDRLLQVRVQFGEGRLQQGRAGGVVVGGEEPGRGVQAEEGEGLVAARGEVGAEDRRVGQRVAVDLGGRGGGQPSRRRVPVGVGELPVPLGDVERAG